MVIRLLYKYISSKPKKQIFIIVEISKELINAFSKYWEKKGGVNFFDDTPFRIFSVPHNKTNNVKIAKEYYGGEEKWIEIIKGFIGKQFKIKTPHYDINYLIKYFDFYDDGQIERVEVDVDPNGKVRIDYGKYGDLILTIEQIFNCKNGGELLDKYYPQVEKDSEEYNKMWYELDMDFFDGMNNFVDSLEEHILSELSGIITKPYGAEVEYVVMENGKKEQFTNESNLSEQFDRIKTLINFSCK